MSDVWRILVVEGDETLNQHIVNTLRKDGYIVRGVLHGADAVRLLWSEEQDIVICSIRASSAEGFELLQWLHIYRPGTQMIMVGDANTPALRSQALESGAVSYFERPLDLRLLKDELRGLLQQSGFSASLDSFDLLDVIQIITMSRKSITLLLNTGLEERGILRFQNGELIWAEYGVLRGEEAFFALAAHKNGTVTQQNWNEPITANVTQPLSRLIFQALQYRSKYADRQQFTGEQASLSTLNQGQTVMQPLTDNEIDDSPFLFFSDDAQSAPVTQVSQPMPALQPDWQVQQPTRTPLQVPSPSVKADTSYHQAINSSHGVISDKTTSMGYDFSTPENWWESDRQKSDNQKSGMFQAITPDDASIAPTMAISLNDIQKAIAANGASSQETLVPPTLPVHQSSQLASTDLPGWLTGQATQGNIPAVSTTAAFPSVDQIPATPHIDNFFDEWTASLTPPKTTNDLSTQSTFVAHTSSPTWPGISTERQSSPDHASVTTRSAPPTEIQTGSHNRSGSESNNQKWNVPQPSTQVTQPQQALSRSDHLDEQREITKRNYAALVSALQTIGYSITGFIAAAVVHIDGHPIAQVAVDDLDISLLCRQFSALQKDTAQKISEQENDLYQEMVITTEKRHVLMRIIANDAKAFLMLLTTRDAQPQESFEVMANVEGAIRAALP